MSDYELKDIPQAERELEYLFDKKAYFNNELKKMSGSGLSPSSRTTSESCSSSKSIISAPDAGRNWKILLRFLTGKSAMQLC